MLGTWLSPEAIDGILRLDAAGRYQRFVTRVVDTEEVWGLHDAKGWVSGADDAGHRLLPLWPDKEFAELMAVGEWSGSDARALRLDVFLADVLPDVAAAGNGVAIFMTPSGHGIVSPLPQLQADLKSEKSRY